MLAGISRWINKRWPLDALIRIGLEEEMPGGASYAYVFGSSLALIFLLQITTGICQLFYYIPSTDHAYNSLNYLRTEVPFGWLIHGFHYWGATTMILLVGIHMCRVFIWGAYKHPRELTWLIGLTLLLVTSALSFTGPTLAWNEQGYWAAEVGTSIAGTIPFVGDLAKNLLRGGAEMGQLTLSRFFILHIAILPGILLTLITIHVTAFRRFGISGPWDEEKRRANGYFWPDQIFKDTLFFSFIFLLLIGLTVYFRPPFEGPADPLDNTYIPKPEWNFLFLYQALKYFHGNLEPVGTVTIPLVLLLVLVLIPFLDRGTERNPAKRRRFMIGGLIFVCGILISAFAGYYSQPGTARPTTPKANPPLTGPSGPVSAKPAGSPGVQQGAQLFRSLPCLGCHRVNGQGGTIGPALSAASLKGKSRQWLITQIRNPKANYPNTIMPPFSSLTDSQVNNLVGFLLVLEGGAIAPSASKAPGTVAPQPPAPGPESAILIGPQGPPGRAAYTIGTPDRGSVLFRNACEACHGPQGTGKIANPGAEGGTVPALNPINRNLFSKTPQTFAENIDRYIQHGSMPAGIAPPLHMLPFGDTNTLTQQVISNIEAYILQLNGVDRAQSVNPGIPPRQFFWMAVIIFGVISLGLGFFWKRKARG